MNENISSFAMGDANSKNETVHVYFDSAIVLAKLEYRFRKYRRDALVTQVSEFILTRVTAIVECIIWSTIIEGHKLVNRWGRTHLDFSTFIMAIFYERDVYDLVQNPIISCENLDLHAPRGHAKRRHEPCYKDQYDRLLTHLNPIITIDAMVCCSLDVITDYAIECIAGFMMHCPPEDTPIYIERVCKSFLVGRLCARATEFTILENAITHMEQDS